MFGYQTFMTLCLIIIGIIGLSFFLCSVYELPSPVIILKLALALVPPSKTYTCFDEKLIAKPRKSSPFREDIRDIEVQTKWRDQALISLDQFLENTRTKAFLVIHEDTLIVERYFGNSTKETLFPANSVTKVFVSTLIGKLIENGKLNLNDKIEKYFDEGAISDACANVTIHELLNGRSRINVPEKYSGLWGAIVKMYLTTNLNKFISRRERLPKGTDQFEYRSVDAQFLGNLLANVTGTPLSTLLEAELWGPLGAEYAASWSVDSERYGIEKAFSGLNATARDFAKLGAMYLQKGRWNGMQIISANWATQPMSPAERDSTRKMGYRNNWWSPFSNVNDGSFSSIGIHGQYIYVDPANRTVIVKLSEHGIEEDLELTFMAFQQVARRTRELMHENIFLAKR